jgi:hypothetical protein
VSRLARALPWTALLALAAGLCLQRILSADYWWLLRTGQLIADTGRVPHADVYTWTVPGASWVDIHWLFQLGLWGIFRLGGHEGVVLAKLAAVALVLALLAPIGHRPGRAFVGAGALGLLLLASCERFMPRPEIASWVLLAAALNLFDRFERRGDAWIWAIVPLQLLWANLHGLFALGLALCGIHLLGELALPLGDAGQRIRWPRVRVLAGVTALSCLATLANPNGLDGALYPIQQLLMVSDAESRGLFGRIIIELQPTLGSLGGGPLLALVALVALSGAALMSNWRNAPPADLLQWVAFLYLALGARRNVPIFAIVAAPLLVRHGNLWLDRRALSPRLAARATFAVSALLVLLAAGAASGGLYERMSMIRKPGLGVDWWNYPVAAADRLERDPPRGPLAHNMIQGGYLIWRLYPRVPVMFDGRLEIFGPQLFETLLFDSPAQFRALDARYGFGAVVQPLGTPGAEELFAFWTRSPEWRLVAVDDAAALFVRVRPGDPSAPPALDLDAPGLFPPIDGSRPRRDQLLLAWRTVFLASVGRSDLALRVWHRAVRLFPELQGHDEVRNMLEARLGRGTGA